MRPYILLVIIGVIVAALAALAVRTTVGPATHTEAAAPAVPTTRILVAGATVSAGSFVRTEQDLRWEEWPSERVQSPPYITEEAANMSEYDGAVARRTIFAGEPISHGALVRPGEGGFLSAVLSAGSRAVSLPVNATTGNAGFIFPGDRVDLILTHAIQTMRGDSYVSETFVEDIRVLAVDQMLDNPENKALLASTVTLEVSPRQAEAVNVALEMGKISLALRSLAADDALHAAETPPSSAAGQAAASPYDADAAGLDYFYPDMHAPASAAERAFTRDADVSRMLGGAGGEGRPMRVKVIRGEEISEIEFRQTPP